MESPWKYNHVYHVMDAADFPMSILPDINTLLDLMPLRSKNRRSRAVRYYHDQKVEMSFIITRSDLLAPTKEQVDRILPYLQQVLRDLLGRTGRNVRLGNIRLVSSRRSWWTKELKEDIWKRGGAGWMIGKVNVGKSQLFEAVFPKGRMGWRPSEHQLSVDLYKSRPDPETQPAREPDRSLDDSFDPYSLLPPAPAETEYPEMPLVSDLPGTTASPIRVPFGNGRGELIDMPGLERTKLEHYVKEEHRLSLIMKHRIVPEQMVIKPGQSLLIGGFIRITPRQPGPIVLSYAFTPIEPHLTATDKAIDIQAQTSEVNVENIAVPGTGEKTKLAGSFQLKWDVTKQRSGPLTRKDAIGLSVDRLPYRVLSADIVIEGVGWVEVTAQVRLKELMARRPANAATTETSGVEWPEPSASESEPERELTALERLEALAEGPAKKQTPPPAPAPQPQSGLTALERLEALAEDPKKKKQKQLQQQKQAEKALNDESGFDDFAGAQQQGEPQAWEDQDLNWPVVDVFSPEGKFISCRRPMNGWILNKPKVKPEHKKSRPRKSMKGAKKLAKQRARQAAAAAPKASF